MPQNEKNVVMLSAEVKLLFDVQHCLNSNVTNFKPAFICTICPQSFFPFLAETFNLSGWMSGLRVGQNEKRARRRRRRKRSESKKASQGRRIRPLTGGTATTLAAGCRRRGGGRGDDDKVVGWLIRGRENVPERGRRRRRRRRLRYLTCVPAAGLAYTPRRVVFCLRVCVFVIRAPPHHGRRAADRGPRARTDSKRSRIRPSVATRRDSVTSASAHRFQFVYTYTVGFFYLNFSRNVFVFGTPSFRYRCRAESFPPATGTCRRLRLQNNLVAETVPNCLLYCVFGRLVVSYYYYFNFKPPLPPLVLPRLRFGVESTSVVSPLIVVFSRARQSPQQNDRCSRTQETDVEAQALRVRPLSHVE